MPDLLTTHRALLERWRQVTNLVGPGPLDPHYDDAERALRHLQPTGRWVDLGTGAGFPGIVLAARFPTLKVDLVDSRKRRCAFLERVLTEAGADPTRITVRCLRVEELPDKTYDGIVARAFAPPPVVLRHARRLLVPGGKVLLFLQGDSSVPPHEGFQLVDQHHYTVQKKARQVATLILD